MKSGPLEVDLLSVVSALFLKGKYGSGHWGWDVRQGWLWLAWFLLVGTQQEGLLWPQCCQRPRSSALRVGSEVWAEGSALPSLVLTWA